ncbi:MAG: thioesterase [Clostridia bacterium]|nr:thioesterase [Clostridia bacterium]
MKFKQKFKVIFHDTDINGIIYPSRLLMFMQESAHGHTEMFDCAPEVMIKRDGSCFWLTRICISIFADIRANEEVEVVTFATNDSRGFSFNRCFEIYRGDEKVACGYSVWALMKLDVMRPVAVKDWSVDLGLEDPIKPSAPLHVRIPRELDMSEMGLHTVYYRDIDNNGHMNNARYPDVICGFLPHDALLGKRVEELSVSFLHEAAKGETVKGFFAPSPDECDVYFVRTVRMSDGEVNVEARVKLAEIGRS